jgi:ferredoxin
VLDPKLQGAITELRTAGLNIMMSMKDAGKPVSFVEDCAVPLEHLADYTARLTDVFERNGTTGTWYAHASVGCLHVRPILNLRLDKDVKAMRAIAHQAFAFVREYKGSHSGEHGDGIVRSEWHEFMFGKRLVRAFEEVKDRFDPAGLYNPGKIVRAPKFDDKTNFRYGPDYHAEPMTARLDWSAYTGAGGGFQGAVEMCNNNGACRASAGGVMCPSYRVTRDERDTTRGRANSLRLAITGQLGPDALTSDDMAETLKLCVSCKGCRRECPTGVDMARMKIEVQAARAEKYGLSLHDRLVGYLPRYAPYAAKLPWLLNLRDVLPGAAALSEAIAGFSARRSLPKWRSDIYTDPSASLPGSTRQSMMRCSGRGPYGRPLVAPHHGCAGQARACHRKCGVSVTTSVARLAVDYGLELFVFLAGRGAADRADFREEVFGLQPVALFHVPHAVIGPGAHVVGIGGERLVVPFLRLVVVAELAVGIADVIGDVGVLVLAKRMHGGDAAFVVAGQDLGAGGAVAAQELLVSLLMLLLFGGVAAFLLFLALSVVARRRAIGAHRVDDHRLERDSGHQQSCGGEHAETAERWGGGHG